PQARTADDDETRDDVVALVRRADPAEVHQTAVFAAAADEREELATLENAIPIEVRPLGALSPAPLTADPQIDARRDAAEPDLPQVEPELLLEHLRTLQEQGVLDLDPGEPATLGQAERLEELRGGLLALGKALDEARLGVDGEGYIS